MMIRKLLPLLALCVALSQAHDVLDFSDDFDSKIAQHDVVLVKFFAPWCGHCKRLAPEFEQASIALKKNDPPVTLADVDCTTDNGKDICSKFSVSGYPTLKIFRGGDSNSEYNGPRESAGIIKHMKAQVGPSSKEIKTKAELDALIARDETIVFGVFKEKDSALHKTFVKLADKNREQYIFAHTHSADIAKAKKLADDVQLIRAKKFKTKFEENEVNYDGSPDTIALDSFIKKQYHGLVGFRTQDNFAQFEQPLLVAYYDVDYVKNAKGTNYWRNRILKAVQDFAGKVNFAIANKDQFAGEMDDYGLKAGDKPVVAIKNEKGEKFKMEDEFSVENLNKFIKQYFDGKLEPHFKSEDLPADNSGPVKTAVAKNFEELVTNSKKDVLIEFYAPWCGHCKKLAPAFEELGTAMEGENVEIVKMDATANDVPSMFEVQGFPTLYWYPKETKKPQRYEGGRDAADFIKYIAAQSTDELNKYDRKGNEKKVEL